MARNIGSIRLDHGCNGRGHIQTLNFGREFALREVPDAERRGDNAPIAEIIMEGRTGAVTVGAVWKHVKDDANGIRHRLGIVMDDPDLPDWLRKGVTAFPVDDTGADLAPEYRIVP